MTKVSIRRFLNTTKVLQLVFLVLVLASTSILPVVRAQDGGEEQQHVDQQQQEQEQEQEHQEPPPPVDPVPPQQEQQQQEEAPPVQEDAPVVEEQAEEAIQEEAHQEQREAPPVQEEEEVDPPVAEEEPPVQEEEEQAPPQEESPPVTEEETPPVEEEKPPPIQEQEAVVQEEEIEVPSEPPIEEEEEEEEEESPPPIDESLFEIKVFECVAPRGDPAPKRKGAVPANSIMTLCIRPKNEDEADLRSIASLDFSATRGPSQAAVKDNESAGPMTRAICPMQDDSKLCIAATKLNEDFFSKAYKKAAATGRVVVAAAGETRTIPFEYKFSTSEAPKQAPVEHEFFDYPETPPPFPCGPEIRIWLISALILTLLEFAFSPDSSDEGNKKGKNESSAGTKKKKSKKE